MDMAHMRSMLMRDASCDAMIREAKRATMPRRARRQSRCRDRVLIEASGGGGHGAGGGAPWPPALPHGLHGQFDGSSCYCMINDEASRPIPVTTA